MKKNKKKIVKNITQGIMHIKATFNNTIVSITDASGNLISQSSAGRVGFKGSRKSTPYAATQASKAAIEKAKEVGLQQVAVKVSGVGSGREAAVRALQNTGLTVTIIKDVTTLPHGGVRPKKPRRV